MKLTADKIAKLKSTKICFHYSDSHPMWIDGDIIAMPGLGIFAEDYASYFVKTEFYTIGAFSYSWSPLPSFCSVWRYCSIAGGVEIMPGAHPTSLFSTSSMIYDPHLKHRQLYYSDIGLPNNDTISDRSHPTNNLDVIIGNDVYIATAARIRRGVKIGDGAIIGAYSVVTKDVAPYSVVVGNPARVVRQRFSDRQISRLLGLCWWKWDFHKVLNSTHIDDADLFIDRLEYLISNGSINAFSPKRNFLAELLS